MLDRPAIWTKILDRYPEWDRDGIEPICIHLTQEDWDLLNDSDSEAVKKLREESGLMAIDPCDNKKKECQIFRSVPVFKEII